MNLTGASKKCEKKKKKKEKKKKKKNDVKLILECQDMYVSTPIFHDMIFIIYNFIVSYRAF